MAITTHSNRPGSLTAGDSYRWKETPVDMGDITSLSYVFRSIEDGDVSFAVTGVDNSDHFTLEIDGADTDSLSASDFSITQVAIYSWGRESKESGVLTLLPNPTTAPSESFSARMVKLLEAHIEGRLPEGLESHTIGGVPVSKISLTDAQQLLSEYRSKLAYETKAELQRRNPDGATGNTIHIHF